MKKSLLVLAVAMLSTVAFAEDEIIADPTAGFQASGAKNGLLVANGEVRASTCSIENKSLNKVVNLQPVASNELRYTNSVAGLTAFELAVTGCSHYYMDEDGEKTHVGITFKASDNISQNGNLENTIQGNNAARNVEVQLLDADSQVINLNDRDNVQKAQLTVNTDSHIFQYYAQYVTAGGPAYAGKFSSSIPFEVVYK